MGLEGFDPCLGPREHFSDHLDGEPVPFVARFHLAVCPRCRRLARSLQATREALVALRDADTSDIEPPSKEPGV